MAVTKHDYQCLTSLGDIHPHGILGVEFAPYGWPDLDDLQNYEQRGLVERFSASGEMLWRLSAAGAKALKEERCGGSHQESLG